MDYADEQCHRVGVVDDPRPPGHPDRPASARPDSGNSLVLDGRGTVRQHLHGVARRTAAAVRIGALRSEQVRVNASCAAARLAYSNLNLLDAARVRLDQVDGHLVGPST